MLLAVERRALQKANHRVWRVAGPALSNSAFSAVVLKGCLTVCSEVTRAHRRLYKPSDESSFCAPNPRPAGKLKCKPPTEQVKRREKLGKEKKKGYWRRDTEETRHGQRRKNKTSKTTETREKRRRVRVLSCYFWTLFTD